ncbi:MAG TPA: chemotaxis protein CheA [Candidatus Deferrimicrobiaceae bacterium]|nr:chemotaxis protein CheA [Candidatus Deferrimicrobiaceae bacterium]
MSDDALQDPSLIQEFLVESEELLQRMDQDLVALEATPSDAELLNRIFRALHTIKGTSGFLGFEPVIRLSHRAEDVLNALRKGEVQLTHPMMDALLSARDYLGKMMQDIRAGGLKEYELGALLRNLEAAQTVGQPSPSLGQLLVKQEVITPAALDAVLAEQSSSAEPRKLGQMLVDKGLASPAEVGDALVRQKEIAQQHAAVPTMRVDAAKLDDLINLIGELVLERNRLLQLSKDSSSKKVGTNELSSALAQSSARLSFITEELQSAGLKTRMVPIETVFRRFPRLVRDVSGSLQKEVDLSLFGQDTELDKTMVELVGDPLVHLVRNSLDHGVEMPEVREKSGKPRRGSIRLEARQEGDQIVISIRDDGAGMDPARIGRKAVDKGLVTAERLRGLSAREILDFIFLPGFSTAEKTTDLSGRGVGMDVVRTNLKKLNGSVEIDSHLGQGTTVKLRLPLTLAILPVLLVQVEKDVYALPLRSVAETAQINPKNVHQVEGSEVLCLRGETLPLLRLDQLFPAGANSRKLTPAGGALQGGGDESQKIVILGVADKRFALLVDQLLGQESTVIKPLGAFLHGCSSLAGATISGDGQVRLVLDPAGLLENLRSAAPMVQKASA